MTLFRPLLAAVLGLAFAGQAYAACQMTKAATLHVSVENNRILVPGTINGTPVRFLLATDIESLILPGTAHDLGLLRMTGARHEPFVYAEELDTTSGPIKVADLTIDGYKAADMVMHVIGHRDNFGAPTDIAVIGRDLLRRFEVEFNLPAGEVNLFLTNDCQNANLAYWTNHYNQLEMEGGFIRGIRVKASINGTPVIADINSGNPYTALDIGKARQLDLDHDAVPLPQSRDFLADYPIETSQVMVNSVALDREIIRPAALRIRKLTVPSPLVSAPTYWDSETGYARPEMSSVRGSRLADRGASLSLGVDFIRAHRMLIAYSQNRVYFSYTPGQPFLTPAKAGTEPQFFSSSSK